MYFSFGSLQHFRDMLENFITKVTLMHFGARLREWRKEAGVTQKELAEKSGISLNTIARIEREEIDPKCSTASKLWQALVDMYCHY